MSDNLEFEVDSVDVEWPETAVALQGEVDRLRAENARLRAEVDAQQAQARHAARRLVEVTADRDRLLGIVARMLRSRVTVRLGIGRWSQHGRHLEPIDPDDLALIREALGRKDDE